MEPFKVTAPSTMEFPIDFHVTPIDDFKATVFLMALESGIEDCTEYCPCRGEMISYKGDIEFQYRGKTYRAQGFEPKDHRVGYVIITPLN